MGINLVLASLVFVGNYFYLTEGGLTLKAACSSGFALMGLINLIYALAIKAENLKFNVSMATGLVFACLGDIVLGFDFIIGAALFAIGHICYFISYCMLQRIVRRDFLIGGILFVLAGGFVLFCPLLEFPEQIMQIVCLVYALIISMMLGKAISNFYATKTILTTVILVGSVLFFFSDLMLVFDWFMGMGKIAGRLCMGTYYPAECLLGLSACLHVLCGSRRNKK